MNRIRIVTGHFGSGKTEFAVNLALRLADGAKSPVALADLDIVNPYFRSSERRALMESRGVRVISSSLGGIADLPAIPAEVLSVFEDARIQAVLDVGGDAVGARVLRRFSPYLNREECELLFVLNANRPETRCAESACRYLSAIRESCGLPVSAIVNNTHLCRETTAADIQKGAALALAVSGMTGVPVRWHVAERRLVHDLPVFSEGEILPIDITMTKPWEIRQEEETYSWLDL